MMRSFLTLFVLLLAPALVLGADLQGMIYDQDLNRAQDVILTIDTTPEQRTLSTDGTYSFTIPPGNYTLTAQYSVREDDYAAIENIIISDDGSYTYDLFLIPGLDEELDLNNSSLGAPDDLETVAEPAQNDLFAILGRLLIVLSLFGFAYLSWTIIKRRFVDSSADDDISSAILREVDKEGGRITQKELRKRLAHSEAAISLAISELEHKGRVEKIKKGRGNIITRK